MQHSSRFLTLVEQLKNQVVHIDAQELLALLNNQDLVLIDVREQNEFDHGCLPHAIHLSKGVLERDIEKIIPDPAANIVVYCSGGFRSVLAAYNLKQMGYTNVKSLLGGVTNWKTQGFELDHSVLIR